MEKEVRVRFAPSPTGYLHVGGLRTALYNYLFAKHNKGKFILRIEDTDQSRYVEGAVEKLINSLKWVGLNFDEGPEVGGNYGPYFQSKRLTIYKENVQNLIEDKKAYYCFCTPERLTALREEQQKLKLPQAKYDKHCLHLSEEDVNKKLNENIPHVIRLNVEPNQIIRFEDHVRGTVEFNTDNIDDQILIKSDGFPTYHLANVVDDFLMKISHVIRGEEWLSSTPKHVILYNYFGWNIPEFAHLPLLLNPDKSKLSKRQGDVAVEDYRDKGYLKEALINFVALLGWNFGDDQEYYLIDEMIDKFSLERVNKAGAVFNVEKLDWLNGLHIRNKSAEEILPLFKQELLTSKYSEHNFSDQLLLNIIEAMKERINFVKELIDNCNYFYEQPASYDKNIIKKRWKDDSSKLLNEYISELQNSNASIKEEFESALKNVIEKNEASVGRLIHPLRLAVSGVGVGPGMYDLLVILGKEETINRIKKALIEIPKLVS
ncbi:MAG: glutamate--tRNA ligase [Ignavibacteriales bacterium]|nr:glutamate--tRNA ligase [Ignavibacteriales bacterium]MCB9209655.1 glutamate--tRNA ligase [Ignavibacteriales bacterium]MCB9218811.1 glutamate--tRNA ligase [Ignavibacteriales bacterium]